METIRGELEIEQPIGVYLARHTFSTVLKRKGHSCVTIMENYLDSFEDAVKLK